jgi:hypothetical protein
VNASGVSGTVTGSGLAVVVGATLDLVSGETVNVIAGRLDTELEAHPATNITAAMYPHAVLADIAPLSYFAAAQYLQPHRPWNSDRDKMTGHENADVHLPPARHHR